MLKLGRIGCLVGQFGLVFAFGLKGVLRVLRVLRGEGTKNEGQACFDPWEINLIFGFCLCPLRFLT